MYNYEASSVTNNDRISGKLSRVRSLSRKSLASLIKDDGS